MLSNFLEQAWVAVTPHLNTRRDILSKLEAATGLECTRSSCSTFGERYWIHVVDYANYKADDKAEALATQLNALTVDGTQPFRTGGSYSEGTVRVCRDDFLSSVDMEKLKAMTDDRLLSTSEEPLRQNEPENKRQFV